MDRIQEASIVVRSLNQYFNNELKNYELITIVCSYFDKVKDIELSPSDLKFLKYISNIAGIPHYYDLLFEKFNHQEEFNSYNLNTLSSMIYESTLHIDKDVKIHKYQKEVLNCFDIEQQNRFFLSASTSFGKTFLIYEIIKKMHYKNIVLIFPTIALLSENYEKLMTNKLYSSFRENFTIHTLSDAENISEQNIFIYTPERFLSFIDKNTDLSIDFTFVDEIYKIDNEYLIDNINEENERDTAYRVALYNLLFKSKDILLVGPYINSPDKNDQTKNQSFNTFLDKNEFKLIDYNKFEIVNKSYNNIFGNKKHFIDDELTIDLTGYSKKTVGEQLAKITQDIKDIEQNIIIYTKGPGFAEKKANEIIKFTSNNSQKSEELIELIEHLESTFKLKDWSIIKGLNNKIGIHHGLVPKYIQKEIISLFNKGDIDILISTTTITEGVNTSAKNLLVLNANKGNKPLKTFDAKNIAGRAGRFLYHYSGRVLILKKEFQEILNGVDDEIKHKNYDKDISKNEIDYFITDKEFLNDEDNFKKEKVKQKQKDRNIPDEIMNMYKVISHSDKIEVYDRIKLLLKPENLLHYKVLKKFISGISYNLHLDYSGFNNFLWVVKPIIKNDQLNRIIEIEISNENGTSSLLTNLLYFYLKDGFIGSVKYKIDKQNQSTDEAIRTSSQFVFNVLKYQLVKYLGVFNLMYKFLESQSTGKSFDEITGIDKLLVKLEYNATSENGKLASDYGTPNKIIEYYDNEENKDEIKQSFDNYEMKKFEQIENIING
ncbi:MAG TPA: helicase-related protein [Sulfurimonas sp.]|uniref:helicase-related protein n=1 Tax=Sulfurimonas sp. TaxID=2022749 RepID=UPI002BAB5CC8|nr:helicase-related protein [Sulfurimonas sp.]HUH41636.1 helicase-related protein [Sulfurimonas sp.]